MNELIILKNGIKVAKVLAEKYPEMFNYLLAWNYQDKPKKNDNNDKKLQVPIAQ